MRSTTSRTIILLMGLFACLSGSRAGIAGEAAAASPLDATRPGHRLASQIALLVGEDAESLPAAVESALATIAEFAATSRPRSAPQGYRGLWFIDFGVPLSPSDFERAIALLQSTAGVAFASEIRDFDGVPLVPAPELLIVLERGADTAAVVERLAANGASFVNMYPGLAPIVHVALDGNGTESHRRARDFAAWPDVASAEVNYILHLPSLSVPNDPLFPTQWALENTGQTPGWVVGADLNAPLAWDLGTGADRVKIAILDEGVDFTHPDLAPRLGVGYEATDQPSPGNLPGNALLDDEHGTACAGIAAASGNNGVGIAGVCWNATILPVRIGYASYWSEIAWQVDAITWATDAGADVLSNSWGGIAPSPAIRASLQYSLAVGRGGRGCVLVFAAGNTDGPIVYPAKYAEAIAVGATSPCDERKSPTSCDGETFWGSNHGLELDLVAPGVKLTTTDTVGPTGSDPGDYDLEFNGTSAACPYVAGAAALLLSMRPGLTASEVRAMLTSACVDQVGPASEDTLGWDQFMGWGRLDLRALLEFVTAPNPVATFDCTTAGVDVTLTWSSLDNYDAFRITRNGLAVTTALGTATQFVETMVPTGNHRYAIVGIRNGVLSPRATCVAFVTNGATDLVWSPPDSAGSTDGGAALLDALSANGVAAIAVDEISSGWNLDLFERIWVNLGVTPSNHVLTEAEALPLVEYLTNDIGGSSLYLEGADTWAFDAATPLHPFFSIDGLFDGSGDLDNITGFDVGTVDFSFVSMPYGGENAFIDQLAPLTPAVSLLRNGPFAIYDVAIYHEAANYRTVGASLEFGGLINTTTTRDEVMAALIDLLTIPRTPFLRGDANGSGVVNLADAVLILAYLFNGTSLDCLDAIDVNDTGGIDVADAVYTLTYLFSSGPVPAAPFPVVGIDPTDLDPLDCGQYP